METTNAEYKELLNLNNRLLLLINLTNEFRNKVKQLNYCLKLINAEKKAVKASKMPVSSDGLHSLLWRYDDLAETVKKLKTSSKAGTLNKYLSVLENLRQKTETEIKILNEKLNPVSGGVNIISSALENTAQIISKKLGKGAQKLGDTIGEAVSGKVEELKKHLAGDEN